MEQVLINRLAEGFQLSKYNDFPRFVYLLCDIIPHRGLRFYNNKISKNADPVNVRAKDKIDNSQQSCGLSLFPMDFPTG